MAKKASPAPAPEPKPAAKVEQTKPKYGVNELVEASGLVAASVRVALRDLGVEKTFGKQYGWSNKADFDTVVKALAERSAKRPAMTAKAPEAKPASKPAAGKPATKPAAAAKAPAKAKAAS